MTIREKINEYISNEKDISKKTNEIANNILNIIDDEGLELDEFREDTGIESWTEECIFKHIELNTTIYCLTIEILFMLEDSGLSLMGNGWLDDDELTTKIIDALYDPINEKIKSKQLFINTFL